MNLIKNQTILITGSTDGIGKQTALELVKKEANVIIHGRNEERAKEVVKELKDHTGNPDLDYVVADLSSFEEIRKISEQLNNRYDKLDVLINNAGVYKNEKVQSKDGFELTFAVNHLSYFLLTGLLLDLIKNSFYSRIVNVASQAHASQLDFDNLQGEKYYDGYDAYSRSKLCNIMFTYTLSQKLEGTGITANVLHPGVINTKLLHEGFGMGGSPLTQGSKTSIYLASSEEVAFESGKYFSNQRLTESAGISYDSKVQDKLWEVSEKMTGFSF